MIENFNSEVNSKLELGEIIEKSFEAKNYDIIEKTPDIAVGGASFITTEDYSFKYSFIITNKRIFIGNMNPFNTILSYKIYNREDIININDFKDKKKVKLRYLLYIGGLIPLFMIIKLYAYTYIINNKDLASLLSAFLTIVLVSILYKFINKFTTSNRLVKEISLRNGKKLTIILNDNSALNYLQPQS